MGQVGQVGLVGRAGLLGLVGLVGQVGLAALQSRQIYDQPLSESLRLRVSVTDGRPTIARVALVDRRDGAQSWELAAIVEEYETDFAVDRADEHAVVLSRSDPGYGTDRGRIKLFFDATAKRLLKRVEFDTSHPIDFVDDADAGRTLGIDPAVIPVLRARGVLSPPPVGRELELPARLAAHRLPQSTYRDFARARPGAVANGYSPDNTEIEERVGAFHLEGDRFWVAKTFYDGEGTTGVGGIGTVDAAGRYAFLRIPELFEWSVESLLIEPDAIWAGRVTHPEGADRSGGLLRYDRKTRRIRVYEVPDVIHAIVRVGGAIFLGTNHGLYVINGDTRTRFRAEPAIDGRFMVVRENLSSQGR